MNRIRRALVYGTLASTLFLVCAFHAQPLIVWHLRVEPVLRADDRAGELRVETVRAWETPPDGWATVEIANFALRAPIRAEQQSRCALCAEQCQLPLAGGSLAVFGSPPRESYAEILDQFAPDERDLSLLRPAYRNWRSVHALTERVQAESSLPESFRFVTRTSKGVVTAHRLHGRRQFVVYAFSPDGAPARVIAVAGVTRGDFLRTLGSLAIGDAPMPDGRLASVARCR